MVPIRLLSSVAVIGRDNEPIYLRGDLCDCNNNNNNTNTNNNNVSPKQTGHDVVNKQSNDEDEEGGDKIGTNVVTEDESYIVNGGSSDDDDAESSRNKGMGASGSSNKKGLFGRIKGVVGRNNADDDTAKYDDENKDGQRHDDLDNDNDDDDDDPFGFFGPKNDTVNTTNTSSTIPAMSLTQQLVLHASLDRFEEMASRSNKGGAVRWRTPGSNSANAMWMGLLCQVEERWNVYGYLTNTGIKFMILIENIYMNPEDGTRFRQDNSNTLLPSLSISDGSGGSGSRETDLKNMFAQLHELYVRYTMNPFSQLRSPIQSKIFDNGIVNMAKSFNTAALEQIVKEEVGGGDGSVGKKNGLVWM